MTVTKIHVEMTMLYKAYYSPHPKNQVNIQNSFYSCLFSPFNSKVIISTVNPNAQKHPLFDYMNKRENNNLFQDIFLQPINQLVTHNFIIPLMTYFCNRIVF